MTHWVRSIASHWIRYVCLALVGLIILSTMLMLTRHTTVVRAAMPAASWSQVQPIVARNTSTLTVPPPETPSAHLADGAFMGNGDMTVAVGGAPESQSYYITQTSFFADNNPHLLGGLNIAIPALAGASYHQENDPALAEVRSSFANSSSTVKMQAWTSASENTLVISLTNSAGTASPSVTVKTYATNGTTTAGLATGSNAMWVSRAITGSVWSANAAMATRILGATATYSTDNTASSSGVFTLSPGQTVTLTLVVRGGGGDNTGSPEPTPASIASYVAAAQSRVAQLNTISGDANSVLNSDALHTAHLAWWQTFWTKGATVDLGGSTIERYWYTSLYFLACSRRTGFNNPAMQGIISSDNPEWSGNWVTDYNVEMPYHGIYSANHPELADPYYRVVNDAIPSGQSWASQLGEQGVRYQVVLGPGGGMNYNTDWGMKGDAAWLSINFVSHWNYTHDTTWAQNIGYPYLIQVANFWDADLTKDVSGRYVVQHSGQNEYGCYDLQNPANCPPASHPQFNPIGDLAWLHAMYPALLQMSQTLNLDSGRRAKWQDIIAHLSTYPTFTNNGHTDYKATEDAAGFYGGDANPVNAVFPGNDIGLSASPTDIQTARNTTYDLGEPANGNIWGQANSFGWVYPAAARIGLPDIYARLSSFLNGHYNANNIHTNANGTVYQQGGGDETMASIETVDSMLLSGYDSTLHLFPAWPMARNAAFTNMRTFGGLLVSASLQLGQIQPVTVTSTVGGTITMQNPWAAGSLSVTDGGASVTTTTNYDANGHQLVSFSSQSGHTYLLQGAPLTTPVDLAQLATASASSDITNADWYVNYVNDGQTLSEPSTLGWSSNANLTSNHSEWVQLDFGTAVTFNQVTLFPRSDVGNVGASFPSDFTIATSNDGSTWTTVVTQSSYPLPSSPQPFTFTPKTARYVRVTGTNLRPNPNDGNQYRMQFAEVGVYANLAQSTVNDTFTNGSDNWTPFNGTWTATNGQYTGQHTSQFYANTGVSGRTWSDATYEFDAQIANNEGQPTNWVGALTRLQNAADIYGQSGYLVYFRSNGQASILIPGRGDVQTVATSYTFATMTHVKIVMAGNHIQVYLNNEATPTLDYTDASNTYGSGYFSLIAGGTTSVFGHVAINQFGDTFATSSNWTPYSGNWSTTSNQYAGQNTTNFWGNTGVNGHSWSDATYEFDTKITNNEGQATDWVGALIRLTHPGDTYNQSGYMVYLRANGQVNLLQVGTGDVQNAMTGLDFSSVTHVRIVTLGNQIEVFLNRSTTPVLAYRDNNCTYLSGYFSLIVGGTSSTYQNLAIH